MKVEFMTTLGCHLCDQAWAMVDYLKANDSNIAQNTRFSKVEISESDLLMQKYAIRIPVLVAEKGELGWPFEIEQLAEWLNS